MFRLETETETEIVASSRSGVGDFCRWSASFAGFYAAHQQIGGVPAFAFADLSVDRIVLSFNPIGHRQARSLGWLAGVELNVAPLDTIWVISVRRRSSQPIT